MPSIRPNSMQRCRWDYRKENTMTVREYLTHLKSYDDVTFIVTKAVRDENTPFYHPEYRDTPIRMRWEWEMYDGAILDAIILNDRQPTITWLSGVDWSNAIKENRLKCLLVIAEEDLIKLYNEKQAKELTEYIERNLFKKER